VHQISLRALKHHQTLKRMNRQQLVARVRKLRKRTVRALESLHQAEEEVESRTTEE
jgi:hypothetical protein